MAGQRKAQRRESADVQMEKGEKDERLKIFTAVPRTILYVEHLKNEKYNNHVNLKFCF